MSEDHDEAENEQYHFQVTISETPNNTYEATDTRDGESATGETPGRALRSLGRRIDETV